MFEVVATVNVKSDKGTVIAHQDYQKVIFEGMMLDGKGKPTGGDTASLLGAAIDFFAQQYVTKEHPESDQDKGVIDMLANVTYANDLGKRAAIRQSLVTNLAGPDKAIEKQIKDYMAGRASIGKPVTEEVARQRVQAMMEAD